MSALYIHFPHCLHLCNYCDFYKHKLEDRGQVETFEELLRQQLRILVEGKDIQGFKNKCLDTLYIGGGTPSLWKPKYLSRWMRTFQEYGIQLAPDCEFTMEMDPDTFDQQDITGWKELGVNRVSVGVQSFNDDFLKILDRRHSVIDIRRSLELIAENFENYSFDLMLGVPESAQRERDVRRELEGLLTFEPSHFSLYILNARKGYPLRESLPDDQWTRNEYLKTSAMLCSKGFDHYEVSNFSKPGMGSRHNQKYWQLLSVAAIGPNATGTYYQAEKLFRYQWKSLSAGFVAEEVVGNSLLIEKLMLGLRRNRPLDLQVLFPASQHKNLYDILTSWKSYRYIREQSKLTEVVVTPEGYLMNDSMLHDLMRLLN